MRRGYEHFIFRWFDGLHVALIRWGFVPAPVPVRVGAALPRRGRRPYRAER